MRLVCFHHSFIHAQPYYNWRLLYPSPRGLSASPPELNKSRFCFSSASAPKQMHEAPTKKPKIYLTESHSLLSSSLSILETNRFLLQRFIFCPSKRVIDRKGRRKIVYHANITHFSYHSSPPLFVVLFLASVPRLRTSNASYALPSQSKQSSNSMQEMQNRGNK